MTRNFSPGPALALARRRLRLDVGSEDPEPDNSQYMQCLQYETSTYHHHWEVCRRHP
jgi:hypothetical protein